MARVAVIGEPQRIREYGLAGAVLCPASNEAEAVFAWRTLPDDIEVAVLTPRAARWLASEIARRPAVLPVLLAEAPPTGSLPGQHAQPESGALPGSGVLAEPDRPDRLAEPLMPPEPRVPPDQGGELR
jgi:hypothetical protein